MDKAGGGGIKTKAAGLGIRGGAKAGVRLGVWKVIQS